jgi:hypothetical protein
MQAELAALHIAAQQPEKNRAGIDMPGGAGSSSPCSTRWSHQRMTCRWRGHAEVARCLAVSDADLVQLVLCQRALQRKNDAPGR